MLQQCLLYILSLHLFLLVVYIYLIWNWNYWKKRGAPTARPLTLIGTFPSIITRERNFIYDIQETYRKYKGRYRAIGVFVTRKPELMILDPQLAHDVLVTNFSSWHDTITSSWVNNRKADKIIARNPFWCAGEEWKEYRTDLVGGLTQNKVKQSYAIWQNSCRKMKTFLDEKTYPFQAEIETKDLAYRYTADVMSDFIWGIDAGTFTNPQEPSPIVKISSKWTTSAFNMLGYSYILNIAPFVRYLYPFRFNPKDTDKFFSKLTKDAVEMRKVNQKDKERSDFLNHLLMLKAKKGISHDDMVGHSLSILMDGYETAGIALMHCLLYLAKDQRVQEKLRNEILSSYSEKEGGVPYEQLIGLPYLDQCIYETLRLITLIPSFSRICTKPTKIPISPEKSIDMKPGMVAIIPTYSYHHDGEYFPEPEKYSPERFDNGTHYEMIKKGILLPFGDGPRICAGSRLAMLTLKSALVSILHDYDLRIGTNYIEKTSTKSFVLSLDGDAMIVYTRRQI